MTKTPLNVVKIGGSLFDLADLPERLRRWRAPREDVHDLFVVGGGAAVDALRRQFAERLVDDSTAHWEAIDLMGRNAILLANSLTGWPLRRLDAALWERVSRPGATFLDVPDFMRSVEPTAAGQKLPVGWDTTSDAIAGRVAIVLGADELVLLKSARPPVDGGELSELAAAGYVDPALPRLADELPRITFYDLRAVSPLP